MDLSVVKTRALLPVTRFSIMNTLASPVLDVRGESGLKTASSVEINGIKAENLTYLSDNRLLAAIPTGVKEIITVEVFTENKGAGAYKVGFELSSKKSIGLEKVIQKVIKVLLTSKGSDLHNLELGEGLQDLVGRAYSSFGELSADVSLAIQGAESSIKEVESRTDLAASEKLDSLTITSISPLFKDGISIQLTVTNMAGEVGYIGVPL